MNFGLKLKNLRKEHNLTQQELAIKIGVSASAVGLYEQERREPDNETMVKIAKCFDVSVDYLLGFSKISEDDFAYAAYDELTHDLTPEQVAQLKTYADFLRQQK